MVRLKLFAEPLLEGRGRGMDGIDSALGGAGEARAAGVREEAR
jgi:hypothetical protein